MFKSFANVTKLPFKVSISFFHPFSISSSRDDLHVGNLPVRTHYLTSENTEYYILINIYGIIPKQPLTKKLFDFRLKHDFNTKRFR